MHIEGIEIIQAKPGRLSLAVAKLKGNTSLAEEFRVRVSGIRGITSVEVDPDRGEVQMCYDKAQVTSLSSLWALKDVMAVFFPEVSTMQWASYLGTYL
jgi:copper chaperone CopZ|uniref:Heavy-metal-associated domain-containing protein n=1 Tax=Desulfobacca acetoxidans TaxID=60893 RepID=A0A7V6A2A0_9BACT